MPCLLGCCFSKCTKGGFNLIGQRPHTRDRLRSWSYAIDGFVDSTVDYNMNNTMALVRMSE
jgi:hypothetical protein